MRVHYPKEIYDEMDYLKQYFVFNGKRFVVKPDAPEGTQERYDAMIAKMRELEGRS